MCATKRPPSTAAQLTPWEAATGVAAEAEPGLIPARASFRLTLFLWCALAVLLWPSQGAQAIPISLLFARLMALDLTTYTLPNIYTLPLLAVSYAHAFTHSLGTQALIATLLIFTFAGLLAKLKPTSGFGGGDLKLLAAFFAMFPAPLALTTLALGCLLYLPATLVTGNRAVPFGIPIVLAWVICLVAPSLPSALFSPIS